MKSNKYILITMVLYLVLLFCSSDNPGVSGTETTNGKITAYVSVSDTMVYGEAPSGTRIILNSSDYNPILQDKYLDTVESGIDGKFEFRGIDSGSYNITAVNSEGSAKAFISDLIYRPVDMMPVSGGRDSGYISDVFYIEGELEKDAPDSVDAFVYIQGSPFFTEVSGTGEFRIESVPRGDYTLLVFYRGSWAISTSGNIASEKVSVSDSSITGIKLLN